MKKKITKIQVQKNNKNRVNVFLNNEFAFACSSELVYYHSLEKNKEVDTDALKEIIDQDNYIKAKNAALRLIEKSYKTENEVFEKLIKFEYDEKICAKVIAFLKDYGFVDDEKYTGMFIRDKIKSCGKNKIQYQLNKKGISKEIIQNALDNVDEDLQIQVAEKLAKNKYKIAMKSEKDKSKVYKKVSNYLVSKGYDYSIINNTMKKISQCYEEENYNEDDKVEETDIEEIKLIAEKRYKIVKKSEDNKDKIYRKLGQYLLRRGYRWEDVKVVLRDVIQY